MRQNGYHIGDNTQSSRRVCHPDVAVAAIADTAVIADTAAVVAAAAVAAAAVEIAGTAGDAANPAYAVAVVAVAAVYTVPAMGRTYRFEQNAQILDY